MKYRVATVLIAARYGGTPGGCANLGSRKPGQKKAGGFDRNLRLYYHEEEKLLRGFIRLRCFLIGAAARHASAAIHLRSRSLEGRNGLLAAAGGARLHIARQKRRRECWRERMEPIVRKDSVHIGIVFGRNIRRG